MPGYEVHWTKLEDDDDDWRAVSVLYAYYAPTRSRPRLIYIGKAGRLSVADRYVGSDKQSLWDWWGEMIGKVRPIVCVGHVVPPVGERFTQQKLADIEALLIHRLRPAGNVQNTRSRGVFSRPGMVVRCIGDWFHSRETFRDS